MTMFKFAFVLFLANITPNIYAFGNQFSLGLNGTYLNTAEQSGDNKTEVSVIDYNLSLGYIWNPGFHLGIKYFHNNEISKIPGGRSDTTISGYGPMLGFIHQSGVFLNAVYIIEPIKELKAGTSKAKSSGGTGYTAEVGKLWVWSHFATGVHVAYTYTKYEDVDIDGVDYKLVGPNHDKTLYPALSFYFFL